MNKSVYDKFVRFLESDNDDGVAEIIAGLTKLNIPVDVEVVEDDEAKQEPPPVVEPKVDNVKQPSEETQSNDDTLLPVTSSTPVFESDSKYLRTDDIKFMEIFGGIWFTKFNELRQVKGFPEGLDLENTDIIFIGEDYIIITAGGDWQQSVNFSFYVNKRTKNPIILDLYNEEGKMASKEINEYLRRVEEIIKKDKVSESKKHSQSNKKDNLEETLDYINSVFGWDKTYPAYLAVKNSKNPIETALMIHETSEVAEVAKLAMGSEAGDIQIEYDKTQVKGNFDMVRYIKREYPELKQFDNKDVEIGMTYIFETQYPINKAEEDWTKYSLPNFKLTSSQFEVVIILSKKLGINRLINIGLQEERIMSEIDKICSEFLSECRTIDSINEPARNHGNRQSAFVLTEREDFRDGHAAPAADDTPVEQRIEDGGDFSLAEVAQGFHIQPDNYFLPIGARYYNYDNNYGKQSYSAISKIINGFKSKGESYLKSAKITAYRAIPKDIPVTELKQYDWITFSKAYAVGHGEHRFGEGEYKVITQEVSPYDVWWDGNDINEWGYDPSGMNESVLNQKGFLKEAEATDTIKNKTYYHGTPKEAGLNQL